jgi:uncharacterized membrane protein (UPF0127 family)
MARADRIANATRGTILHENPEWALSLWQQSRGFMFSRPGGRALIFLFLPARIVRLHMLFVLGSIDVIALDGTGKTIALKENFSPWSLWSSGAAASAILELPEGAIARTGTRIGDKITLPQPPLRKK